MLQVWAGSKQRELGANSMQLMHQYCPWAALFLGIMVPLVEPVGWHAAGTPAPAGSLLGFNYTVASTLTIGATAILGRFPASLWSSLFFLGCAPASAEDAYAVSVGRVCIHARLALLWGTMVSNTPCTGTASAAWPGDTTWCSRPYPLVPAGLLVSLSTLLVIGATSSVTFKCEPSPCLAGNVLHAPSAT